jgi:RimJ/RimL family protein N-acetyltransferase
LPRDTIALGLGADSQEGLGVTGSARVRIGGKGGAGAAPIELETHRLRLVCWQECHIAPFAAMNADPEVMRWFPSTLSEEQTRAGVRGWQQQFAEKGWSNWAVESKADGSFIGFVGLSVPRRQLPFSPCVEVGWRLARAHWGHGFATEAARESLRFGFESLHLEKIVSFTALGNRRSRAVMERLGMLDTGRDFEHPAVPQDSPLRPHCLYAITRERWEAHAA